jgi:hypothetical protein
VAGLNSVRRIQQDLRHCMIFLPTIFAKADRPGVDRQRKNGHGKNS